MVYDRIIFYNTMSPQMFIRRVIRNRRGLLAGVLLGATAALAAVAAMEQESYDWCKDHPLFPAPPGFKCADKETQSFGAEEFLLEESGEGTVVEGRRINIKYYLQIGASPADPAAIVSFYRNIVMSRPAPRAWMAQENGGRAAGFFTAVGGMRIFIKVSARQEEVELTIVESPAGGSAADGGG